MLFDAALDKQSNKGIPCKSSIHLHQRTKKKNQPQRTKFDVMAANQSQFWMDRVLPVRDADFESAWTDLAASPNRIIE